MADVLNPTPPSLTSPTSKAARRVSVKVAIGRTYRRAIRIEQAARLVSVGMYSNQQIADHMGIHVQTLVYLKNTAEFQSKLIELATGVISSYDKDLREDIENNGRAELRGMVPLALQRLRIQLMSKNESISARAVEQILDREGTLSRVSRTSVSLEPKFDPNNIPAIATDLMALLGAAVPQGTAAEINMTTQTASPFTMNAADASAQALKMRDAIDEKTLEEIDLAGKVIQ